jgi:hypothetical protein
MDPPDSASVATNRSMVANSVYKSIRKEIRKITSADKMIEYVFECEEELANIPTHLLNTWAKIDGWTFIRHRGNLRFMRKKKDSVRNLNEDIQELRSILSRLIIANGLKLPDDE